MLLFGGGLRLTHCDPQEIARHPIVVACVDAIATIAASVRPTLRIGGEVVTDHPLLTLIWHPGPQLDYADLVRIFAQQWFLWGRMIAEKLRSTSGEVVALYPIRPQSVESDMYEASGALASVVVRGASTSVRLPAEDVLWGIDPAPWDPRAPYARIESLSDIVRLDASIVRYVSDSVAQGMVAKAALVSDVSPEMIPDIERRLNAKSAQRGWHVYDSSRVQIVDVGLKPSDIDVSDLLAHTETRICMLFGVPPIVVSALIGLKRATYANYREARQRLVAETIAPWVQRLGQMIETQLAPDFGLEPEVVELVWDWSELIGQEDVVAERWQRAARAWETGLTTRNEARAILGLPRDANGDVYRSSISDITEPGAIEEAP